MLMCIQETTNTIKKVMGCLTETSIPLQFLTFIFLRVVCLVPFILLWKIKWKVYIKAIQINTHKDKEVEDEHEVLDAAEAVSFHARPPRWSLPEPLGRETNIASSLNLIWNIHNPAFHLHILTLGTLKRSLQTQKVHTVVTALNKA